MSTSTQSHVFTHVGTCAIIMGVFIYLVADMYLIPKARELEKTYQNAPTSFFGDSEARTQAKAEYYQMLGNAKLAGSLSLVVGYGGAGLFMLGRVLGYFSAPKPLSLK